MRHVVENCSDANACAVIETHSCGQSASIGWMARNSGSMRNSPSSSRAHGAIRGSLSKVARSGGGEGSRTSQASGARVAGSCASSAWSRVVPVRGRPRTKRGRVITSRAIPGFAARSAARRARFSSRRRICERAAMRPSSESRASLSSAPTSARRPSRNSFGTSASTPTRDAALRSSASGSSDTGRIPRRAPARPSAFRARIGTGRTGVGAAIRPLQHATSAAGNPLRSRAARGAAAPARASRARSTGASSASTSSARSRGSSPRASASQARDAAPPSAMPRRSAKPKPGHSTGRDALQRERAQEQRVVHRSA